jgi:CheY-like chemotaxis protein
VLLNLAGNAVKFTESGSVSIGVTQPDETRLKVSVADTGIGISGEQLATLFQRYTQADSSTARRYGGTGLGLAISKTLVELMGGEIGALSTPGAGSTFWFVLPLRAGAPTELAAPAPPPAPSSPERPRLLLVEDNFVNQRVALYLLAKLGYEVDVAQHGREAIDRLSRTRYRLVLMDCQMPEMDGFETTRLIRDPASRVLDHDVPIIAMTANAFPEDRARSISSGMSDFLSKPVDPSMLAAMLTKWLGAGAPDAGARDAGAPDAGAPDAGQPREPEALKTGS